VVAGVTCGKNRLTAKLLSGATEISTGSLIAGAPGGIVTELWPRKVSARPDPATIAAPFSATATCAAPITSGLVPYSFDSTRGRAAADADGRDLANGLIPERTRNVGEHRNPHPIPVADWRPRCRSSRRYGAPRRDDRKNQCDASKRGGRWKKYCHGHLFRYGNRSALLLYIPNHSDFLLIGVIEPAVPCAKTVITNKRAMRLAARGHT
jgi:hypothetical protein